MKIMGGHIRILGLGHIIELIGLLGFRGQRIRQPFNGKIQSSMALGLEPHIPTIRVATIPLSFIYRYRHDTRSLI